MKQIILSNPLKDIESDEKVAVRFVEKFFRHDHVILDIRSYISWTTGANMIEIKYSDAAGSHYGFKRRREQMLSSLESGYL